MKKRITTKAKKTAAARKRPKAAARTRPKAVARIPVNVAPKEKGTKGHWVSQEELALVRSKLQEAQETLDAIRSGEVDAVVVSGPQGSQIYSLSSVEQPYRVYVERMQEGAVTASPEGLILYCNQRFAEMLKMPLERVIGSAATDYLPAEAFEIVAGVIGANEEAVKHECSLQCAGGSMLPVNLSANALPLPDQTVICLVVTDLTLQRGQESLRLARDVAERANLAKDSFLAALSHELRTPLTPALMSLMALEGEEELTDFVRNELAMIRRNIELETRLIDDLLDLTRIANGKLELHTMAVDLHVMLARAVEICRASIDAKQQKLDLHLRARHTQTMGDTVRLQQVLWNLLRNAVKFTSVGGVIVVTTADAPGGGVEIEVTDTGIGFEPGAEDRLFLPFEQSGRGVTRQFGGLGLGLAISRAIIEAHGGTIKGRSDGPGKGATFTVALPLTAPSAKKDARPARRAVSSERTGHDILVVEDHEDTRSTLQRLLERVGHRVSLAASAKQALSMAGDTEFDLVISDLGLPDMTGAQLMSELRDRHGLRGIAVSGYGMEADVARSREAGFVHHLTKPIHFERLKELIAATVAG